MMLTAISTIGKGSERSKFFLLLSLLTVVYGFWLIPLWPGVLGEDSYAILREVLSDGEQISGKTAIWYYFAKITFGTTHLVEAPIIVQTILVVIVFSRILAWAWQQRYLKTLVFCLIFICVATHTIFFVLSLYPDAIYSVAVIGLLFELWRAVETRRFASWSLCLVAVLFPFAIYARSNGLVFLLSVLVAIVLLRGIERTKLILVSVAWISVMIAASHVRNNPDQGAVFPLVLFETVNFMRPHPMNLWQVVPRVTDRAVKTLEKYSTVPQMVQSFDPDYWDTLIHRSDGPQLGGISEEDRKTLTKEFFKRNLWRNIPAFMASRLNIFLVASLAKGGFPSFDYTPEILKRVQSGTRFRPFELTSTADVLMKINGWSFEYFRWLLWTPFVGIFLLFKAVHIALRDKNRSLAMIGIPLLVQLAAIFLLSTAGEYRYLLTYSLLPVLLLPILNSGRAYSTGSGVHKT